MSVQPLTDLIAEMGGQIHTVQYLCPNCGGHAVTSAVGQYGSCVIVCDDGSGATMIDLPSEDDARALFKSMARTADVMVEVAQRWPGDALRIMAEVAAIRKAEIETSPTGEQEATVILVADESPEVDYDTDGDLVRAFTDQLARTAHVPSDWPHVI